MKIWYKYKTTSYNELRTKLTPDLLIFKFDILLRDPTLFVMITFLHSNNVTNHVFQQSKILDPKYYQEKQQPEDNEYYDTEFRARPPKKLENVVSELHELVGQFMLV